MSNNKNVYLFHGLDTFSSKKYLNFWKDSFVKKYGNNADIEEYTGKKVNIKSLILNINSLPFLCDKRLIIINDFFATKKIDELRELAEIIGNITEHTIVIFYENKNAPKNLVLYKRIKKFGTVKEFSKLTLKSGIEIIKNIANEKNSEIDEKTASFLFTYLDGNAWNIFHEMEKLSTFTNKITKKIIETNVTESLNSSVFKLTDALNNKNLRVSLSILTTLLNSGENAIQIFFMIARNFRLIIQIKELIEQGLDYNSIAKELKLKPFAVMQTMRPARNFTFDKLKSIYSEIISIDIKMKTGGIKITVKNQTNYILAIEMLIINICK